MKVGLISLGCAKNQVDSEMILGVFKKSEITNKIDEADVIIVNTCGFIESAKKESIDTILEMADYHKKLIVTGCLVERYYEDLKKSLPEVDLFIRIKDYPHIKEILSDFLNENVKDFKEKNRLLITPKHLAYLRISDGCNNRCSYCAIPLIRGNYRSRLEDDIYDEAISLVNKGVKEIVLISQDTTRYGSDLGNTNIVKLLKRLEKIEGIEFIRFLYLYPSDVTDELIECVKNSKVITPYFDIPIQHASDKMLKLMNRRDTNEILYSLVNRIRKAIPNAVIRTTVMLGFPYEEEEDFNILKKFVSDVRFDKLGGFTYSKEEGTKGYFMPQVNKNTAKRRLNEIMHMQEKISLDKGLERVGEIHKAIIEDFEGYYYIGRSFAFAPDDVDGYLFIESDTELKNGDIVNVEITDADSYNLFGKKLD
ncbi:MAG: 30S ribosomal protein S12 methylthiotransferase RimO [bacterium]|nr:30S ribosomal protein S12 methylthiotransferase RimO [bacterium]